jgi:hypothetical protein
MILNYREPQLNIDQKLATDIPAGLPRQAAVLVGAQYVSPGFESNFTKTEFDSDGDLHPLSFTEGSTVYEVDEDELILKLDTPSVKLFVENAEYAVMFDQEGDYGNGVPAFAGQSPNIVMTEEVLRGPVNQLNQRYGNRSVKVGDIAYVANQEDGGTITRRKIKGFVSQPIPSTFGSNADSDNELAGGGLGNPVLTTPSNGVTSYVTSPVGITLASEVTFVDDSVSYFTSAVTSQGLSVNVAGQIKAGVRLSLRILSFNGTDAGTMSVTSSDGIISGTGTFEVDGTAVIFDLASTSSMHGVTSIEATKENPSTSIIAGQIFAFTLLSAYAPITNNELLVITDTGDGYTGSSDNTFYLRVITGHNSVEGTEALLRVYDSRGTFTPRDITIEWSDVGMVTIELGGGLSFRIDTEELLVNVQGGFRKNDVYFLNARAIRGSSTLFSGLILDGPAVISGAPVAIKIRAVANGEITVDNQLSSNFMSITGDGTAAAYSPGLTWKIPERDIEDQFEPLVDGVGKIYFDWRAVKIPSASERVIGVYSDADLAQFGPAHIKNDIAFAAKVARESVNGEPFFVLKTTGQTAADFTSALEKIENSDTYYALACISDDPEAFYVTVDHAEEMSLKTVKNFRKVYFGVDSPSEFILASTDAEGQSLTATVTTYNGAYRYVVFQNENIDITTMDIFVGDLILIDGGRLIVEQIVSENEIIVTEASAPLLPVSPALPLAILKTNTPQNQIYYVSQIAETVANRRGSLIWCDKPVGFDGVQPNEIVIPVKFAAAEIAAIRSITPPQLGLTRQEIKSFKECPNMYTKFNRNLLNQAAANGVMIITQEHEAGPVFVRHQLTTEVDKGYLYYEDSVTTNVDNLSFQFKDALEKYIGRKNVTPTTLSLIAHDVFLILDSARSVTFADAQVGPQILEFYDENKAVGKVTVKPHPTFKDRVQVKVIVTIPLPLNILEVEIEAISEVVTITE